MKPRRVVLTIELETNTPLKQLRSAVALILGIYAKVFQVQANVIRGKR